MEVSPAMRGRGVCIDWYTHRLQGPEILAVHSVPYSVPSSVQLPILSCLHSTISLGGRQKELFSRFLQMRKLKFRKAKLYKQPYEWGGRENTNYSIFSKFSDHWSTLAQVHSSLSLGKVRVGGSFCGTEAPANPGNKCRLVWGTELGGSEVPVKTVWMRVGKPFLSWGLIEVQLSCLFSLSQCLASLSLETRKDV